MRARRHWIARINSNHQRLCGSPEWAAQLQETVLSRLCGTVELGDRLLEIGPGPGAATDWLRHRVASLVAIEIDPLAAEALRERFAGSNVDIVTGDATRLPWPDRSFDAVATFTMLHHVPTLHGQTIGYGRLAVEVGERWTVQAFKPAEDG
jgi:protein-L-isoaspartate O-methyltransferase